MSDTHPNVYRVEADEKRRQAAILADQANALEDQARAAEAALQGDEQPEIAPAPDDTEDDKKSRFSRK